MAVEGQSAEVLLGFDARETFIEPAISWRDERRSGGRCRTCLALSFAAFTDQRVPEHAPFYVFALRAEPTKARPAGFDRQDP